MTEKDIAKALRLIASALEGLDGIDNALERIKDALTRIDAKLSELDEARYTAASREESAVLNAEVPGGDAEVDHRGVRDRSKGPQGSGAESAARPPSPEEDEWDDRSGRHSGRFRDKNLTRLCQECSKEKVEEKQAVCDDCFYRRWGRSVELR